MAAIQAGTIRKRSQTIARPPRLHLSPPREGREFFRDTVIAYPNEITRVKALFDRAGLFVWHCHIVEHEDNEMMRPYRIGPAQPGEPGA